MPDSRNLQDKAWERGLLTDSKEPDTVSNLQVMVEMVVFTSHLQAVWAAHCGDPSQLGLHVKIAILCRPLCIHRDDLQCAYCLQIASLEPVF